MNAKSKKVLQLYPHQIRVMEGFNRRFDYGDMKGLANSILQHGVVTPIHVVNTKQKTEEGEPIYELIDGHRRLKAVNMILPKVEVGTLIVPAMEFEAGSELEYLTRQFVTGAGQQSLNLLEKADIIKVFRDAGHTPKQIAEELGVSITTVKDCLFMVDKATPSLRSTVEKGKMSATELLAMLKSGQVDVEELEEVVTEATEIAESEGKKKVTRKTLEKVAGRDLSKRVTRKDVDEDFEAEEEVITPSNEYEAEADDFDVPVTKNVRSVEVINDSRPAYKVVLDMIEALHKVSEERDDYYPVAGAFEAAEAIARMLKPGSKLRPIDFFETFYAASTALDAQKEVKKKMRSKKPEPVDFDTTSEVVDEERAEANRAEQKKKAAEKKKKALEKLEDFIPDPEPEQEAIVEEDPEFEDVEKDLDLSGSPVNELDDEDFDFDE